MHQRPKIHIFLGAPPPPPPPSPGMEEEEEERPAGWRHLELTWKAGRLRPAADVPGNEDQSKENPTEPGRATRSARGRSDGGLVPEALRTEEDSDGSEEDLCSASVREYLDRCFPLAPPEPEPEQQPLSTRTQFLSTWTLSQALILRGRHAVQSALSPDEAPPIPPSGSSSTPELFSPAASSPGDSMELFSHTCPASRAEQGGVVVEVTADGVLCSQESDPQASPASPPCSKKPRPSEESTSAATESSTSTTRLDRCDQVGRRYSVLVVVVHPCHLKEVQVRSGPSAGSRIPLASMVVTDQSGAEMKVVLWRRAAFWVLTVSPGEVLLITGLQVSEDRWRAETVLQSTFSSKLLNLGHASTSKPVSQQVSARALRSLCGFVRVRRPLLVSVPSRPQQDLSRLPYATLRSLRVNTLVHALLRVTHSHISSEWRDEAESRNRSAVQMKAVLMVQQPGGQQGALLLWGAAMDWLPRFSKHKDAVWDFRVLLVREGLTSDLSELHSTPWSSVRVLDPTDRRALDFLRAWRRPGPSDAALELDVDTLLSQQYSGEVELRVQVLSFQFQEAPPSQNPAQPVLDSSTPRAGLLAALSGDITYTGCGCCTTELDTDRNGIYTPCYACLPLTALRRFYRPGVLTVSGRGSAHLTVRVPPVPLQKILQAPPDRLQRSAAPGSQMRQVQVAAEKLQALLALPRKWVVITVRSHFLCDQNSVPLSQDFTLMDLQVPTR
ncbi:shieldin complex subunit 2-like [Xiphophorus hellerii]|uniref:shieldin complex subunit 2-like n=1 Tax=Xiphophorus hellerii TaxID=8084 RepID=UPI0013B3D320|nr:shieldin complex subunit 2-like [Xiphophorus hellerii]XP_032441178.1 shieldin complex subunit 2-like [Xiphophorus hellerii]